MSTEKQTKRINIRVTEYEFNFIKTLAEMYANGNVSLFMVYSALNANRKMLGDSDLIKSTRKVNKGGNYSPPKHTTD